MGNREAEAWKKGVIAGYQSIRGRGVTPSIPPYPSLPAGQDRDTYYYNKGFEAGVKKAGG